MGNMLPIDINYELDAWGRVRRSIAAAREETEASAGDLETIRLSLHAELAVDYFELRSLDAQKKLLDETLVAYQKALDPTQNRFNGGLSSRAEVAQARTNSRRHGLRTLASGWNGRPLNMPLPFSRAVLRKA